jgi:Putative Flp pilus-assembly TadE/G-like
MRRLAETDRDDRGGATIFVIVAITAVLVGAGFAVDVGQYVVAARSVQNSADATVLAVATDCARTGAPIVDYSQYRKTGQTISAAACGSGVATITATKSVDGLFLQQSNGTVERTATARWGTIGTASVLPLVISDCEFSQALLNGSADITIYLDDPKPQSGCSSLPGGFSQLLGSGCAVTISAGGTAAGQPGGALQTLVPCITNPGPPALPHDVLIPMYDAAACQSAGCNGHGPYTILGFAVFHITGYSFNGNNYAGTLGKKCPEEKDRGKYCLRGDFIKFTTTSGTPGPSTDYGVTKVYLYS